MTDNVLARMFEHHNWANARMIEVCSTLTDDQLEAQPKSVTRGSIRRTGFMAQLRRDESRQ